jgi:hypothetical protein
MAPTAEAVGFERKFVAIPPTTEVVGFLAKRNHETLSILQGFGNQAAGMILYYALKYELWRFMCPQLLVMMWRWRCLWLGWKATPRLLFMPSQADVCCRYLLARLGHYSPSNVLRCRDGSSRTPDLMRIIEKHGIDTNFV